MRRAALFQYRSEILRQFELDELDSVRRWPNAAKFEDLTPVPARVVSRGSIDLALEADQARRAVKPLRFSCNRARGRRCRRPTRRFHARGN